MSIYSLVTSEAMRAAAPARDAFPSTPDMAQPPIRAAAPDAKSAFNNLTKYLPTEVITLYVAALAIVPSLQELATGSSTPAAGNPVGQIIYWCGALLTPILVILGLMHMRVTQLKVAAIPDKWPWWKMIAATVAYLVWGLAVPGNPYTAGSQAGAIVAGFGAILVSTVLSLLDPIVTGPGQS